MVREKVYHCIAIDMGASSIRIMLGDIGPRSLQCREVHRFPNEIMVREGHQRWDTDRIATEIVRGIRKAVDTSEGPVDSLGVDAWGVDFALLDASGNLVDIPVAYRDKRTEGMEEKWLALMSREETFRRTGINFYLFNTLFQLLSLEGSKELTEATRLLFLPSFIASRLCGTGLNEFTISSTSQLLNAETGTWDQGILEKLGIPSTLLGEICMPGTSLGKANHPGLQLPGAEVLAVCSHDTASAVVSVPFAGDSSAFISTGTWCIVGVERERPVLTPEALIAGFTNERGYGGTYRFLKNIVGLWLVQGLVKCLPVREEYNEIESLALRYRGPVRVIDPGDPLFYNPEDMKEAFDTYFRKTGQDLPSDPGAYFRAAYDSLVFSFRYHIEWIERLTGSNIGTIHLIGGACKSGYLTRRTALFCRRKVVSGPAEAAAVGNILVQGIAKGILPGLTVARELVRNTMDIRTFSTGMQDREIESAYRLFLGLLSA